MSGNKFDQDKLRWDLLPLEPMREVVRVLMFGLRKYSHNNWQYVPQPRQRYVNAARRHIDEYLSGNRADAETKLHPLAHAVADLLFVIWFDMNKTAGSRLRHHLARWIST